MHSIGEKMFCFFSPQGRTWYLIPFSPSQHLWSAEIWGSESRQPEMFHVQQDCVCRPLLWDGFTHSCCAKYSFIRTVYMYNHTLGCFFLACLFSTFIVSIDRRIFDSQTYEALESTKHWINSTWSVPMVFTGGNNVNRPKYLLTVCIAL